MIKNKTIGIDIDNTILPLIEYLLPKYNKKYNDTLSILDFKTYKVSDTISKDCDDFFNVDSDILEIKPYSGCNDVLSELNKEVNILFITATNSKNLIFRNEWLEKYFSFYDEKMLIRCVPKNVVKVSLLIDDYSNNFSKLDSNCLLFEQPWSSYKDLIKYDHIKDWNFKTYKKIINILKR